MSRGIWELLRRGGERFASIDGAQWAGALAYGAFASLFPMILLFITAASFMIDRNRAAHAVIAFVESYVPMSGDTQRLVFVTINGMAEARGRAGAAALLILIWIASQGFSTLICATNRAWDVPPDDWWRLPLKSMALLGIAAGALPAEIAASTLTGLTARILPAWASGAESLLLAMAVQFLALLQFYRFAPRRPVRFAGVWVAALIAAILLRAAESAFVVYLVYFGASNAVYGVFGGIMALLLWIYLSGCIFIYGACLCAARDEIAAPRAFAVPP